MIVDKKMLIVARQWKAAIRRIATLEGLAKIRELMIQENKKEEIEIDKESISSTEIEMQTESVTNIEEYEPETVLSLEIEMKTNENEEILEEKSNEGEEILKEKSNKREDIEDIRIIDESSKIKLRVDIFKEKFEQLEEYIKLRHKNLSLDESI